MAKYLNYIRSTEKDINGKILFSGQKVVCGSRTGREEKTVKFEVDYGFKLTGKGFYTNYADSHNIEVVEDIKWYQKIAGAFIFMWYQFTGKGGYE